MRAGARSDANGRRPTNERPFRVLRYRDFRLIWSAEALSQTGTQIQRVAVAWQVFELTGDPVLPELRTAVADLFTY